MFHLQSDHFKGRVLGEGIFGSDRLGGLGIGMISKSAKKDGTLIVHQCPNLFIGIESRLAEKSSQWILRKITLNT